MSVDSFNMKLHTMYWLQVMSVKSGKKKNKEISKICIYFSCHECQEWQEKEQRNIKDMHLFLMSWVLRV